MKIILTVTFAALFGLVISAPTLQNTDTDGSANAFHPPVLDAGIAERNVESLGAPPVYDAGIVETEGASPFRPPVFDAGVAKLHERGCYPRPAVNDADAVDGAAVSPFCPPVFDAGVAVAE